MDFLQTFACTEDGCRRESHLLRCPALVVDRILPYLEAKDLIALRRVCRTTKSWAESRKSLKRIQLHISSVGRMMDVMGCQMGWSNFSVSLHWSSLTSPRFPTENIVPIRQWLVNKVCNKFGKSLAILEFDHVVLPLSYLGIPRSLLHLPSLESLSIQTLDFRPGYAVELEAMSDILGKLKHLRIRGIAEYGDLQDGILLEELLEKCIGLEELEVPWNYSPLAHQRDLGRKLILPLLNHLSSNSTNLRLIRVLNSPVGFYQGLLRRLGKVCRENGIELHFEYSEDMAKGP